MTDHCDFYDMPKSACSHCNPAEVDRTRRQVAGEKADNSQARAIFKRAVTELRASASGRESGTATGVTVDGTRVWVKATLEPDADKTSFQFHDGDKMLSIDVDYIALVNTALHEVWLIRKADADTEARRQLPTSAAGRITLKPGAARVQQRLLAISEVF